MNPPQSPDPASADGSDPVETVSPQAALLAQAIGGWNGLIDSGLPSAVFLATYLITGQALAPSVWAAVVAGALVAAWRLLRHQSVQQVAAGFVGVAFCAWLASRTGRAEDFYLPGLLLNVGYAAVLSLSALIGRPAVGYLGGALTGELTGWREDPVLRRAYTTVTWMFAAMFAVRLLVQVPLYYAGLVAALGVAKLAMGYPLYGATIYLAYRIVARARERSSAQEPLIAEPEKPAGEPMPEPMSEQLP
ncbi:MAG: DUF3159 domain-containing protein [Candidatus Nanopelagicales bacterium]